MLRRRIGRPLRAFRRHDRCTRRHFLSHLDVGIDAETLSFSGNVVRRVSTERLVKQQLHCDAFALWAKETVKHRPQAFFQTTYRS
jgi:hypothetical protein